MMLWGLGRSRKFGRPGGVLHWLVAGSAASVISDNALAEKAVYTLSPDKLAKAEHLYHARTLAHFGDTAWMILALWLLVRWGAGARIRDWAARLSGNAEKPCMAICKRTPGFHSRISSA